MSRNTKNNYSPHVCRLQHGMIDPEPRGPCKAITQRNTLKSPFFLLPQELRDEIYQYVLEDYLIFTTQPTRPFAMAHESGEYIKHALAILRVCRSTYAEARFLPFRLNNFWYKPTNPPMPTDVDLWKLKLLPPQLLAIRTVEMFLGKDIEDNKLLYLEALTPLTGLKTIVFQVCGGYKGRWRETNKELFQSMKDALITRLEEVLCVDGVTVVFKS